MLLYLPLENAAGDDLRDIPMELTSGMDEYSVLELLTVTDIDIVESQRTRDLIQVI